MTGVEEAALSMLEETGTVRNEIAPFPLC